MEINIKKLDDDNLDSPSWCLYFNGVWDRNKYSIISKGSILISVLSTVFTILDTYFSEFKIAKYIVVGCLNVSIVIGSYAFGQLEQRSQQLGAENIHLRRLTLAAPTWVKNNAFDTDSLQDATPEPVFRGAEPINIPKYLNTSTNLAPPLSLTPVRRSTLITSNEPL